MWFDLVAGAACCSKSGSTLTVAFTIGGVAKSITIEGWRNGELGIG